MITSMIGYGLTETCGPASILPPEFLSFGPAGLPSPSVEIKLLDVPEAGYKAQGKTPQGEYCRCHVHLLLT
jgi:long-chain acyl-CoA synthetase